MAHGEKLATKSSGKKNALVADAADDDDDVLLLLVVVAFQKLIDFNARLS